MKRVISIICLVAFMVFSMSSLAMAVGIKMTSITIPKAKIALDGKVSDWSKIRSYKLDTDTVSGKAAVCPSVVKVAWNGTNTLYFYAVIKVSPVGIKSPTSQTQVNWYDMDVFEVFLQPTIPTSLAKNQVTALHYGFSNKYIMKGPKVGACAALKTNSKMHVVHAYTKASHYYSIEGSIPLTGTTLTRIRMGKQVYMKLASEINSAGEFLLLGYPKMDANAFWSPTNYLKATFKK